MGSHLITCKRYFLTDILTKNKNKFIFKINKKRRRWKHYNIICCSLYKNKLKVCQNFLNQIYINKVKNKYFTNNIIIYIKKINW